MIPTSVVLRRPVVLPWDKQAAQAHRLDADRVRTLIDSLHRSDPHKYLPVTAEIRDVWEWICQDDFSVHRLSWQRLVEALGAPKQKICEDFEGAVNAAHTTPSCTTSFLCKRQEF